MKKIVKVYKLCFNRLKNYKKNYCISFIVNIIGVLLGIIEPLLTAKIINCIILTDVQNLKRYLIQLLTLFLISLLFGLFSTWYKIRWTKNFNMTVKNNIVNKMLKCPPYYHKKMDEGYIMNVILEDSVSIGEYVDDMGSYLMSIISIVVSVVIMLKVNVIMAICSLIWFPIIYSVNRMLSKKLNKRYVKIHMLSDDILERLKEIVSSAYDIVCNSMAKGVCHKLYKKTEKTKNKIIETEQMNILLDYLCKTIVFINSILLFIVGCIMIIKNEIRGEEFLVFYSFSLSLNVSLKEIAMMYIGLQNSFVSIERFFSYEEECEYILNEEKKLIGLKKDDEINSLYVNNINFSFDNRKLLNNLSIASSKGKIIGIIGENGTGKTTILKLIMKIYKTQLGEIMLNDYNINDISFESIRQYITYVTPEPIIYEGTILENIILANSYASSKDIEVMIKIMNLKKDIMKMPQNINTKIDNSLKLSTGQKKKIQLIRCLLRNTLIYLFDEPTSGLDENTKFNFRVLLSQIKKHKIIFMISHDKEDLKLCDYVIKLNNIIDNK